MAKYILAFFVFIFNLTLIYSQQEVIININDKDVSKSDIYVDVEEKPEFPGGEIGLNEFYKNTSTYTICDKGEKGCESVYFQIVIDSIGNVGSFNILKGTDNKLNNETKHIVEQMPNWNPGKKDGKPVNVLMTLGIKYKVSKKN